MKEITVNVPLSELLQLYAAVNEYQSRNDSLKQLRAEVDGLRQMLTEMMILIGELRKGR